MSQPTRQTGTSLTRSDPFSDVNQLAQRMGQLFEDQWPNFPALLGRDGFVPQADVEETEDSYLIDMDLPGVDRDDVDIEVVGRRLVVTGERKEKERVGLLRRQTRTIGRFRYEVSLPDQVNEDGIAAALTDGVLHLQVPKRQGERRRRIEVK
jgi:HSP20 family protein